MSEICDQKSADVGMDCGWPGGTRPQRQLSSQPCWLARGLEDLLAPGRCDTPQFNAIFARFVPDVCRCWRPLGKL